MIYENDLIGETLTDIAKKMVIAARTAPKGRGRNTIKLAIATKTDLEMISRKMKKIGKREKMDSFLRDAENIQSAHSIVLIGSVYQSIGLNCGLCGFPDCKTKDDNPDAPCAFNPTDMGIAIGSAVSVAADHRVDNRVMYTIGKAASELNLLGEECKLILGIPLASLSKSPFFDRK